MKLINKPFGNAVILFSVLCVAVCGMIYELLAGTISSYLVGDSVYQFSIVIGIFVSSMGVGSFFTRFIEKDLISWFIFIELVIGILGGYSTVFLFYAFAAIGNYTPFLFIITFLLGALVGLEIPLVIRILKDVVSLKITVSNVFTADYAGALLASVLFPLILVPRLGLMRTAFMFGMLNVVVAFLGLYAFWKIINRRRGIFFAAVFAAVFLGMGFYNSPGITSFMDDRLYQDDIIFSKQTPYQKIVITRNGDNLRMFLDGSVQFDSRDEYRYHESLVHPAMSAAGKRDQVLVIGGGDGMAAREILKYSDVKLVTIVDIDRAVTDLFKDNKLLSQLNLDSLSNSRVKVVNSDGWKFLEHSRKLFDVIIIDLPDPDNFSLSRLYSTSFYRLAARHLAAAGTIVTQASSPLYSREAYWCIYNTISSVASPLSADSTLYAIPYHVYIPSFGEWGFVVASSLPVRWNKLNPVIPLKFLTKELLGGMVDFPADMKKVETETNTIDTHKVVVYYEKGWSEWGL